MVFSESMQFNQNTSDNMNPSDNTVPEVKISNEKIKLSERSTINYTETIGHSWIVGSATNGIVGANTNTQDGGQQVVGGAGRVETLDSISNPNKLFKERFRDTYFKGTGDMNWDTTNHRLSLE